MTASPSDSSPPWESATGRETARGGIGGDIIGGPGGGWGSGGRSIAGCGMARAASAPAWEVAGECPGRCITGCAIPRRDRPRSGRSDDRRRRRGRDRPFAAMGQETAEIGVVPGLLLRVQEVASGDRDFAQQPLAKLALRPGFRYAPTASDCRSAACSITCGFDSKSTMPSKR